ncbi:hypothetical protein GCM10023189_00660 [Nibrella saemangeumensis]|uniref:DUF4856 domain-containing protein n=1 Tax=Nibrella saemangeumensis TaxID=1084526 RepID=A0ABP8MA31_9BACT
MRKLFIPAFAVVAALFLNSCKETETIDPLVIPQQYDGTSFTANTTAAAAMAQQYVNLINETKKARTAGTKVEAQTLTNLFTTGSPSLKSLTTPYYANLIEGTNGFITRFAQASGNTFNPAVRTGNGGVLGGHIFDQNGFGLVEAFENAMYGATFYNQAIQLATAERPTPATADQLTLLFGASPAFPNSNDASKYTTPDRFMALYAARRDKNDGTGLYTKMRDALIRYQAALKAGDAYKADRDAAWADIKQYWEKAATATAINYLHSTISTLSATNPTDAQKGAAMHTYNEAVSQIHGWRTIPQQHKIITDAQIDELLTLMNAPVNGTPTSYLFLTNPVNQLPKLTQAISRLKEIYKFTDQEVEDFKKNWISEQKR